MSKEIAFIEGADPRINEALRLYEIESWDFSTIMGGYVDVRYIPKVTLKLCEALAKFLIRTRWNAQNNNNEMCKTEIAVVCGLELPYREVLEEDLLREVDALDKSSTTEKIVTGRYVI